jgi:hypothetical protein
MERSAVRCGPIVAHSSLRVIGGRKTPVLPDKLWRSNLGERRALYDSYRVAPEALLAMTIPSERIML